VKVSELSSQLQAPWSTKSQQKYSQFRP